MNTCPYCGAEAKDIRAEVAHMEAEHSDILEERLKAPGLPRDESPALIAAVRISALYTEKYGDSIVHPPDAQGKRKVEGVDGEDGEVRARVIFRDTGSVEGAWDPDYMLDAYKGFPWKWYTA